VPGAGLVLKTYPADAIVVERPNNVLNPCSSCKEGDETFDILILFSFRNDSLPTIILLPETMAVTPLPGDSLKSSESGNVRFACFATSKAPLPRGVYSFFPLMPPATTIWTARRRLQV